MTFSNVSKIFSNIYQFFKSQERIIRKPLDPWKASRTPSANMEPQQKTRYDTPVNACKYDTVVLLIFNMYAVLRYMFRLSTIKSYIPLQRFQFIAKFI